MNYYNYAKKLLFISNKKLTEILPLISLFVFASLIEFIGLGLIIPYITIIINPDNFENIKYLSYFNLEEKDFNYFLFLLSIALIIIFFLKAMLSIIVRWCITRFAFKQYAILQTRLMSAYQNMEYIIFLKRNSSEYIRNVKELSSESISCIENFLRLISELIIFTAIIVYLCFVNFKVILYLILILGSITLIYELLLKPKAIKYGKNKVLASNSIYRGIDSGLRGFKEIRILSKEKFFLDIISKGANTSYVNELKQSWITHSPRYIFELAIITFLLSFLSISIFIYKDINLILPTIGVFSVAGVRLLPGSASIVNSFNMLNFSQKSVSIVFDDLKKYSKTKSPQKIENFNKIKFKSLLMKNISYKYPYSKKNIIQKQNFSLKAKECVGIIGESGAGKTTIVDLFLGLLKPNKGQIYLNNKLIKADSQVWLKLISYLPQDPMLIEDTIKTNICLDLSKTSNKKIKKNLDTAITQANIKNFIRSLPNGINTKIGEFGIRLSGGQSKRVALARTFYHDKEIIVMDEATSSLDEKTENFILEQIKELKRKKTVIIITHNKNTLKYCDKVYEIINGKIRKK